MCVFVSVGVVVSMYVCVCQCGGECEHVCVCLLVWG